MLLLLLVLMVLLEWEPRKRPILGETFEEAVASGLVVKLEADKARDKFVSLPGMILTFSQVSQIFNWG